MIYPQRDHFESLKQFIYLLHEAMATVPLKATVNSTQGVTAVQLLCLIMENDPRMGSKNPSPPPRGVQAAQGKPQLQIHIIWSRDQWNMMSIFPNGSAKLNIR